MLTSILRQISSGFLRKGGSMHNIQALCLSRVASSKNMPNNLALTLKYVPQFDEKGLMKLPVLDNVKSSKNTICEIPFKENISYLDIINWNKAIEEPSEIIEKQAARLIVIRRKKMKKHKLKKLRKKMKFEWAKVRQRRELKKEKAFQAELMGKIREAEKFDPTTYASQKINKANEVLIPKLWKGKRLPEFIIKDLIIERDNKRAKKLERNERRKKLSLKVSDYNV